MAIYTGTSGAVVIDGAVLSGITKWTLDIPASDLDGTAFGASWRSTESGLKSWSGTVEGLVDDDATQDALWTAFLNGSTVQVHLALLIYGSYFDGTARILGQSPSQAHDSLATVSWQLQGTGQIVKYRSEASGPLLWLMTQMITQ